MAVIPSYLDFKTGSRYYLGSETTYQVLTCFIVTGKDRVRVHGVPVIGARQHVAARPAVMIEQVTSIGGARSRAMIERTDLRCQAWVSMYVTNSGNVKLKC